MKITRQTYLLVLLAAYTFVFVLNYFNVVIPEGPLSDFSFLIFIALFAIPRLRDVGMSLLKSIVFVLSPFIIWFAYGFLLKLAGPDSLLFGMVGETAVYLSGLAVFVLCFFPSNKFRRMDSTSPAQTSPTHS